MKSFPLLRLVLTTTLAVVVAPAADARVARKVPFPGDGAPQAAHTHTWVKQTRKEWVPPEKKVVRVGVDAKGKPVYETKIVKPGYWRVVAYFQCSCGATRG